MKTVQALLLAFCLLFLLSCATFRSEIKGQFQGNYTGMNENKPVSILFIFTHVSQTKGFDTVPKIDRKYMIARGFNDIFADAMRELNNVRSYDLFIDDPDDVNEPKRRKMRDSLFTKNDYTLQIRISKNKVFMSEFFATMISTCSATLIPVPYSTQYHMEIKVFNRNRQLLATLEREADMRKWVQPFLIILYPFYPEERIQEEIYLNFLHNGFKEIEIKGLLK